MKKIIAIALIFALVLSLSSCGEYNPATNGPKDPSDLPEGSVEQPTLDGDPTNDFTVRLRIGDQSYIPNVAINVYWNDGYNIHIAPIDSNGVATIDGLDGDYKVTLSSSPSGYTYDPNSYIATNDERNIIIDMYESSSVNAKETNVYNGYRITETGVYTVTITEDQLDANRDGKLMDVAYFEFAPQMNGVYTIESWVNTTADDVLPICLAYLGSFANRYGEYKVTDVGACGSYTRNFVHTINIADENISSGGSQTFAFGITAETKSGLYPTTFSFAVKRNGGFDYNRQPKTLMAPTFDWSHFDFEAFNALAGTEKHSAKTEYTEGAGSYIYAVRDQHKPGSPYNYKIWEVADGGDGVYHVYNEEKYSSTGGYGPVLFAYINTPCEYLNLPFILIESQGSNYLTVESGTQNYKQFIEGWNRMASEGYYCVTTCPCHFGEPLGTPMACPPSCTECSPQCSRCPDELMGGEGYSDWCNDDGVVPVTPELADFLQKLAVQHQYFADGEGMIDNTDKNKSAVHAYEDSQWLFACGYYE